MPAGTPPRLAPRVLHATPGRLRVALAGWDGRAPDAVEARLATLPAVRDVSASPATGNALIRFDPERSDVEAILEAVRGVGVGRAAEGAAPPLAPSAQAPPAPAPAPPPVAREGRTRARIAVRGIDRDPGLARRVVERLERRPDVLRAVASQTTGRVLVEMEGGPVDVGGLLADVADLELPPLAGEDRPDHPLDDGPLIQATARLVGSTLGLALIGVRRALGKPAAPVRQGRPAVVSGAVGIAESLPPLRAAVRRALGEDGAQLLLGGIGLISLTLAGSPLGLATTAATSLMLVTEVRARRAAWRAYTQRIEEREPAIPGARIRLEPGDRMPLAGRILEGHAIAVGRDGLPRAVGPPDELDAGARLLGRPVVVELAGGVSFAPRGRPAPARPGLLERYVSFLAPASLAFATAVGLLRRSAGAAFTSMLLVNPRTAFLGAEAADTAASARVLRAGAIVVGTRRERVIARPDVLLVHSPRVLTDGFELSRVVALQGGDTAALRDLAGAVATAAGAPWGSALATRTGANAEDASFADGVASATVDGVRHSVGPLAPAEEPRLGARLRDRGELPLGLRAADGQLLAVLALRARVAAGGYELLDAARRAGTRLTMLAAGDLRAARALAQRLDLRLGEDRELLELVEEHQRSGDRVAVLSDAADAAEAFAACDLALALASGRSGRFPARADVLVPALAAAAAVIESGRRHDQALGASVGFSLAANAVGAALGLRARPGPVTAPIGTWVASLCALGGVWLRLRGGSAAQSVTRRLVDPRPERWGGRSPEEVLEAVHSSPDGLTTEEALRRRRSRRAPRVINPLVPAILDQLRSPLTGFLALGAGLSFATGAIGDVAMIGGVVVANAVIGAWQERSASRATAALERLGAVGARVLRDGAAVMVPAGEVVVGDVLVLAPGDRIVADARVLSADRLEVDEAALTGESFPVVKAPDAPADEARVVLEGSDVTVGTGRAVVVSVGTGTRLGAIAAALTLDDRRGSPLDRRLASLLRQAAPVILAGGLLATGGGLLWGAPAMTQLAVGAAVAVAAVPEGLPLLAGLAESAVARRLARRRAVVRRLAAVEALGRVDVACCDKTGTLTEGRLTVSHVATLDDEARLPGPLTGPQRDVLLVAAAASPHPDAADAGVHPTDAAVVEAAIAAGLERELHRSREHERPFDPTRPLHVSRIDGRTCAKGAVEVLLERCTRRRTAGGDGEQPLVAADRAALVARADALAERGLRVLLVAEGGPDVDVDDPHELTAIGFVGISDPLRQGVREAIARCRQAGVRVVMLTGDHPATARSIARDAGLPVDSHQIVTGPDIVELDDRDLDEALESATVVARITPLEKLRIVESLQRRGHTVAMTGDGVNDAPALRLADVGVAMGRDGTDVARQAADVVLADDDFATVAEALVEGRGFWRSLRRALGMLLGGNLGEMGLVVGSVLLGRGTPLTARQILAVNLASDVLPAAALAVAPPRQRDLGALAREGEAALDAPLRRELLRRAAATGLPSLGAYLLASRSPQARTVAYASVVSTQLAQTLVLGRTEAGVSRPVVAAVGASAAVLALSIGLPPARAFLGLAPLGPAGIGLVLGASLAAVAIAHVLRERDPR